HQTSVSVSLGLAQVTEHSEDISSLMQAAESSCDIAKQTGGNRLQLFYASNAKLSQRKGIISWVTKIDDILDNDGLELRCQRIQPIGTAPGEIEHVHYEILLGLKSDRENLPSIQEFIEAAEYSNRIGHIDRWVVKTVLKWISENEQVLDIVNAFSINLSGKSLSDEKFIDFVLEQIEENNVPAECLCFEITETAGVENLSDAAYFINTIKDTGCGFSLDDFGSGMSSYAYLRDLPVDYLKIDGMFIKNIVNSDSDYAVVKSITEVAHFMGKRVIAEYVENDEIVNVLNKIGVDFAQGFGIDKPHLIEELI
ncbi:MAG: EAL domain-containing protein, partial [Gammaproteobacteria bacterium]|nr:EAL domain-containing protein [Gammaproteobacteria bacterium]